MSSARDVIQRSRGTPDGEGAAGFPRTSNHRAIRFPAAEPAISRTARETSRRTSAARQTQRGQDARRSWNQNASAPQTRCEVRREAPPRRRMRRGWKSAGSCPRSSVIRRTARLRWLRATATTAAAACGGPAPDDRASRRTARSASAEARGRLPPRNRRGSSWPRTMGVGQRRLLPPAS